MNLYSLLEELDRIYEEEAQSDIEELEEEEVIEIEDDEEDDAEEDKIAADDFEDEFVAEEQAEEESPVEDTAEITDYVLECTNCGAVCIKAGKDIKTEENVDLVNVGEACDFCEATAGYVLRGGLVDTPAFHQEVEDKSDAEESDEAMFDEPMDECLTEGKVADSLKKLATRLGADAATTIRALTELIPGDTAIYDAAVNLENKAVLKALQSGNETVLNTLTKDDVEELKQDIEDYKAAKSGKSEDAEVEIDSVI